MTRTPPPSGPFTPELHAWFQRGRLLDVFGMRVFVVDTPASDDTHARTPVLALHGFPTSSFDYRLILPALSAQRPVLLLDFPGYGFSDKPRDYSYSLMEQADVVEAVCAQLGLTHAHLVSHDMGTSVACELLARRQRKLLSLSLASVLFMNGSLYIEMSKLAPTQKLLLTRVGPLFARLGRESLFRAQLKRILSRPVEESEITAMWQQLLHLDGRARLAQTIHYISDRKRFWHRWIGALRACDLPAHVLWGSEDPIAVMAIGERAARELPRAELQRLEGVGHYPMIEAPRDVATALCAFHARVEGQTSTDVHARP
jgi:pimeloyl-ACP methyl ester carboxylesterase